VARLIVNPTSSNRREITLARTTIVTIGRDPSNDLVLPDAMVSRRHAVFTREGGSFRVTDQGSLNGTYVNNEPAITELLADGDEVQIGKFRMSVRLPGGEDG